MENIFLSVIIPIFQVEKYIEKCARSLMEQTMRDGIEYIFIDDCSVDYSLEILERTLSSYPERRKQVKVIRQEKHIGVFRTRELGLSLSKGKYIGWCDSDDWVEKEMFSEMYRASQLHNSDIVVCNFRREFINSSIDFCYDKATTPQIALTNCWKHNTVPLGLPFLITKKELLQFAIKNVIPTSYGEDNYMIRYVFAEAKSIFYLDNHFYHYNRTNDNSLMKNMHCSKEEWKVQKENLAKLSSFLYKKPKGRLLYHVAVNKWKYEKKKTFSFVFKSTHEFYYEFDECYLDINKYLFTPPKQQLKTFLVHNIFFLFWFYYRKNKL